MQHVLANLKQKALAKREQFQRFFQQLRLHKPADLDAQFERLHQEAFKRIDCLTCANCCKTTSPLFTNRDIKVLSKHLRLTENEFIQSYLKVDEDGDYVFRETPCPFLQADNKCLVYDYRPNACREYPHTNQRKMHTIFKETLENTAVCPAVFEVVEKLKAHYKY
ncbi:MAG: YkgJ family cysteine cluster protein [Bacteroidota bacterium]